MATIIAAMCITTTCAIAQDALQLRADNIDEIIEAMTLEEKDQLLVGGASNSAYRHLRCHRIPKYEFSVY